VKPVPLSREPLLETFEMKLGQVLRLL